MGSGGFLITYFAAGIFGNVLGANFALVGMPSIGASGAIFGTVAVSYLLRSYIYGDLISSYIRSLGSIYSPTGSINIGLFER